MGLSSVERRVGLGGVLLVGCVAFAGGIGGLFFGLPTELYTVVPVGLITVLTISQLLTLQDQRRALELERRMAEVEGLNKQLSARVRERSQALAAALARLGGSSGEASMLPPGAVLADRVELGAALGQGAMGHVYRGRDLVTGAHVAVKLIRMSRADPATLQRFLQEAQAAASVDHPAVVRTTHVDVTDDGVIFLVMELVEGVSLEQRLAGGLRLAPSLAARVGLALADALRAAHAAGVVHRDVKPANVIAGH